jgi:hypothetical protein
MSAQPKEDRRLRVGDGVGWLRVVASDHEVLELKAPWLIAAGLAILALVLAAWLIAVSAAPKFLAN